MAEAIKALQFPGWLGLWALLDQMPRYCKQDVIGCKPGVFLSKDKGFA